jgi:hypothetical protein
MTLLLATQWLDAKSIPPGIRANVVLRMRLKVTGQLENDMVLGTSMYKIGIRATMFGLEYKASCTRTRRGCCASGPRLTAAWTPHAHA